MTGAGLVMRRNTGCICNEMSGISLGLGGRRDGFGTEHGTSHNMGLGNIGRQEDIYDMG